MKHPWVDTVQHLHQSSDCHLQSRKERFRSEVLASSVYFAVNMLWTFVNLHGGGTRLQWYKFVPIEFSKYPDIFIQRTSPKDILLLEKIWLDPFKGLIYHCIPKWKTLFDWRRLIVYWFLLFCCGSIISCFLSPSFKRFMSSQCISGNNTNSSLIPPEANVGNNLFPTSPRGQGRKKFSTTSSLEPI